MFGLGFLVSESYSKGCSYLFYMAPFLFVCGLTMFATRQHDIFGTGTPLELSVCLVYPILYLLSPLIFLTIKFMYFLRPNNKFIRAQSKIASLGESIMESTAQLVLQLSIIFLTMSASPMQCFSVVTSAMSLAIPNTEHYLRAYGKESFKNLAKYFPLIFSNSLFKVLTLSMAGTLLHFLGITYYATIIVLLGISAFAAKKQLGAEDVFKNQSQYWYSFLTVTNLDKNKNAILYRFISFYTTFFFNVLFLFTLLIIGNVIPDSSFFVYQVKENSVPTVYVPLVNYHERWPLFDWSRNPFVQDKFSFNLIVILAIFFGVASLVLDIMMKKVFREDMVFHEYLLYRNSSQQDIELSFEEDGNSVNKTQPNSSKCFGNRNTV